MSFFILIMNEYASQRERFRTSKIKKREKKENKLNRNGTERNESISQNAKLS